MVDPLWKSYLNAVLRRKFSETQISNRRATFGVEHEFFLLNEKDQLCSAGESQALLRTLSELPKSRTAHSYDRATIQQVNFQHPESNSYSSVKYEFFPHMLEVAIGFSTRIDLLEERIIERFHYIEEASRSLGLRISSAPSFPLTELSAEALNGMDEKRRLLHARRESRVSDLDLPKNHANFPAFTAGTQIQVGGVDWWNFPGLIDRLYSYEPNLLLESISKCVSLDKSATQIVTERFERYRNVYRSKKLFEIPVLESWTVENWSNALSADLGLKPPTTFEDLQELSTSCHDLSFVAVKPTMGTIEFRGPPSLPNMKEVVDELKRRIDAFQNALNSSSPASLFDARLSWEKIKEALFERPEEGGTK